MLDSRKMLDSREMLDSRKMCRQMCFERRASSLAARCLAPLRCQKIPLARGWWRLLLTVHASLRSSYCRVASSGKKPLRNTSERRSHSSLTPSTPRGLGCCDGRATLGEDLSLEDRRGLSARTGVAKIDGRALQGCCGVDEPTWSNNRCRSRRGCEGRALDPPGWRRSRRNEGCSSCLCSHSCV